MKPRLFMARRQLLTGALGAIALPALGGCDRLSRSPGFRSGIDSAEWVNLWLQGRIVPQHALAREYPPGQISRHFRANGSTDPSDPGYRRLAATGFADWRLRVDGLVERPLSLSLDQLRAMPSVSQITRHDCVEGWSCIGKWTGVPLSYVLGHVRLRREAQYLMFYCDDPMEQTLSGPAYYYESIGVRDAFHPQTLLAYGMNDTALPVPYGAPLRLRLGRQLGYKMAKYLTRIEAVARYDRVLGGRGGYWEDRGYEWYAGI